VKSDTETGDARFAFNGSYDIIGKSNKLQRLSKHKMPRVESERVSMHFTHVRRNAVRVIRVDDLAALFVPDEMIAQPYVKGIGLHQLRVERFNPDIAPVQCGPGAASPQESCTRHMRADGT